MSALFQLIRNKAQKEGPLKLSSFMRLCLMHPEYGYYKKSLPLGPQGDFITAPEVSQLFGEIIGLFFVHFWEKHGRPSSFNFIEFGPGNGTLLKDILCIFKKFPNLLQSTQILLLETNSLLQKKQQDLLLPFIDSCKWYEDLPSLLKDLPKAPTLFIGNEFLDVFPIDQYVFRPPHWYERCIGYDASEENLKFQEMILSRDYEVSLSLPKNPSPSTVFERSSLQESFLLDFFHFLKDVSFSGLFIDYGNTKEEGDSFQALSHHAFSDPLKHLGEQDLTAHVNFNRLKEIIKHHFPIIEIYGPTSQEAFLKSLGIDLRAEILIDSNPHLKNNIQEALFRLTNPSQMGTLFKVLEFHRFSPMYVS